MSETKRYTSEFNGTAGAWFIHDAKSKKVTNFLGLAFPNTIMESDEIAERLNTLTAERDTARMEADALTGRIAVLGNALKVYGAHLMVHNAYGTHGVNGEVNLCDCGLDAILSTLATPQPSAAQEPVPAVELMPEPGFTALWELVNKQDATHAQINLYRAELDRRANAAMSDGATSGKDERAGRK